MCSVKSGGKVVLSLTLLLLLLIVSGLAVGIGTAYYSDMEAAENQIRPGDSNIEIIEEFDPPDDIQPEDHIAKKVQITNKGKSACFVRCRLLLDDEEIRPYLILDMDKETWAEEQDGYFYYKKSLKKGEMTTLLLKSVGISEQAPQEILDRGFSINVYAESYQQGDFDASAWQEAWKYFERNQGSTGGEKSI